MQGQVRDSLSDYITSINNDHVNIYASRSVDVGCFARRVGSQEPRKGAEPEIAALAPFWWTAGWFVPALLGASKTPTWKPLKVWLVTLGYTQVNSSSTQHSNVESAPGFIMASKALLEKHRTLASTIRYWLAGNLCHCTGYDKIVHRCKMQQLDVPGLTRTCVIV